MIDWTEEIIAQIGSYSRAALSYNGQGGYPVTLPLPFTFDKVEHRFAFAVPSLASTISPQTEGSASLTLLRYDPQKANEAYLVFYGQLAEHSHEWFFTPSRVTIRRW